MLILPYIVRSAPTLVGLILSIVTQLSLAYFNSNDLSYRVMRLAVSVGSLLFWAFFTLYALIVCLLEDSNPVSHVRQDAWISNLIMALTGTFISFLALFAQP